METTANPNLLRALNIKAVLAALRGEGQATKARLAQCTGLSTVTVNTALEQLAAAGAVLADGLVPSNGGRPAQSYRYNPRHRMVLALFIREDRLHIQVSDLYGDCVEQEEEALGQADGARFRPVVERMLERYPSLGALCFGVPGVVREGVVRACDHAGLVGADLAGAYARWYGLATAAENDVNLAVLGCTQGPEEGALVYLYVPERDAPGAGIRLGGKLYRGAHSLAGELGRLPPAEDWRALDRGDFAAVCRAVASVVQAYACILDPDWIILHGSFLTERHLEAIAQSGGAALDRQPQPALVLAQDFCGDYGRGAASLALELLQLRGI